MNSLDDLELELRKLPGVKAAGFDESSEMLLVQLHLGDQVDTADQPVPINASRIVARHIDARTAVEIVRWRSIPGAAVAAPAPPDVDLTTAGVADAAPETVAPVAVTEAPAAEVAGDEHGADGVSVGRRARLLAVLAFPDTDELEVHLILDGRRTIGRAVSSNGLMGAVEATIAAIHELGASVQARPVWARQIENDEDERSVIAVAIDGAGDNEAPTDYGIAAGASPIDAAARSTLDALNRRLAQLL
jgi:hypothetical protein